jgi:hypothetical protein
VQSLAPEFFLDSLLNEPAPFAGTNLSVDFLDQFSWHHNVSSPGPGFD